MALKDRNEAVFAASKRLQGDLTRAVFSGAEKSTMSDAFAGLAAASRSAAGAMSDFGDALKYAMTPLHSEYEKILTGNLTKEDMAKIKDSAMSPAAQAELEEVVRKLNAHFTILEEDQRKADLLGPGNLTVNTTKGYRKKNHIGGETFIVSSARIGSVAAGARIIIELRPDFAAEYHTVEMTEDEAISQLNSFRMLAREAIGGDFVAEMKRIRTMDAVERDTAAAMLKVNDYKDFGAW